MRDDAFRMKVATLGVVVHRAHHTQSIPGAVPLTETPDEEWSKDVIDIRRLIAEYPKHLGPEAFRLDFSCICNPGLRTLVKRYFRARIGFWEATTFRNRLKDMKPFFIALGNTYPEVASFAALSRKMIEPFLVLPNWTTLQGRTYTISAERKYHLVVSLRVMFSYMQRHGWEGAPICLLIYDEDHPKPSKGRPRPLPQRVVEQLQNHLHLLPPYARNLVEILSVAGLRAEDALHLPEDCLDYDAAGDPRLRWYNHKMKRDGRPLPVTTAVAEAIERQRNLVREVPDLFGKRYLFRTKRGLYQFKLVCKHLNQLAERVPILGEDGHVYRFKPHAFRHTVGTQMINGGLGIADVMAYLDHDSAEMSLRYAEIDDNQLKQKFKALVLSGQAVGGAALKAQKRASGKRG